VSAPICLKAHRCRSHQQPSQRPAVARSLVALAAFRGCGVELDNELRQCSSGKELIEWGFATM